MLRKKKRRRSTKKTRRRPVKRKTRRKTRKRKKHNFPKDPAKGTRKTISVRKRGGGSRKVTFEATGKKGFGAWRITSNK